jgi:hypothetical protein
MAILHGYLERKIPLEFGQAGFFFLERSYMSKCINNSFEISYFQRRTTDQTTIHVSV